MARYRKEGGGYIARKALPVVAKGLARKAIGSEAVDELLTEQTEDDIVNAFGDIAIDSIVRHKRVAESVNAFKQYLSEFTSKLTDEMTDNGKKKLIIFVDELDRCRPTYAVEVLECIKHLFNVEGVIFVLAIDEEQLRNAISAVYGVKVDGEEYLRKFIDWQLKLPNPSAYFYAKYLFGDFELVTTGRFDGVSFFEERGNNKVSEQSLTQTFGLFAQAFELTLREQAQCFTEINLIVRTLPKQIPLDSYLLAALSVLRLKFRDELCSCFSGQITPREFTEKITRKLSR